MVTVEYPDLSGQAQNAENPNQLSGVPRGSRPAGETADQVQERDMSFDVDTDDLNRVAYKTREATNIAAANFRRFANLWPQSMIMAFRLLIMLSSEKMSILNEARTQQGAPRASRSRSVPWRSMQKRSRRKTSCRTTSCRRHRQSQPRHTHRPAGKSAPCRRTLRWQTCESCRCSTRSSSRR